MVSMDISSIFGFFHCALFHCKRKRCTMGDRGQSVIHGEQNLAQTIFQSSIASSLGGIGEYFRLGFTSLHTYLYFILIILIFIAFIE